MSLRWWQRRSDDRSRKPRPRPFLSPATSPSVTVASEWLLAKMEKRAARQHRSGSMRQHAACGVHLSQDPLLGGWARPRFDPTINYGHVLTVSSFLVAAASASTVCNVPLLPRNAFMSYVRMPDGRAVRHCRPCRHLQETAALRLLWQAPRS
jgi:hypothetical protein